MEMYAYSSYDEFLKETGKRGKAKTEEKHRERLIKKLDVLYRQRDFRSADILLRLADELATDGNVNRNYDMWLTLLHLLTATDEQVELCRIISSR